MAQGNVVQMYKTEEGLMKWPMAVRSWPISYVLEVVKDDEWQQMRLSLKGESTARKLWLLYGYRERREGELALEHADDNVKLEWERKALHCRVDNYLGALRRGGQLNERNEVRKYR